MLATNKPTETKLKNLLRDLLVPGKEKIQVLFIKDFLQKAPLI